METKPFNLQSPEQIAKDYGGNKQKIAQAMQLGVIDPTAGTLAGMFIDRMRSAATQEVAPQQTVAQQTFNPQPPPMAPPGGAPPAGGLGAIAPGGAPPAPPPMGGPPPMGPPPEEAPPPGMAAGGITDLPLPDSMFDEPDNGGYAGGGIVAFAAGDAVPPKKKTYAERAVPEGTPMTVEALMAENQRLAPRSTKYSDMLTREAEAAMSPEAQAAQKKQDMWMTLAQIGAKMATTPGGFLRGAAAGIESALPGAQQMAKERKAEKRNALLTLAQQENVGNEYKAKLLEMSVNQLNKVNELVMEGIKLDAAIARVAMEIAGQKEVAGIHAGAARYAADRNAGALEKQARAQQFQESEKTRAWIREGLKSNLKYREATTRGDFATQRAIENAAMEANGIPVFTPSGELAASGSSAGNASKGPSRSGAW